MDYKYRITIKNLQSQYGLGQGIYQEEFTFPDDENMKQLIERYGYTRNLVLFLQELLNLLLSLKPLQQEQTSNLASLDYETLKQTAEQLWKERESLQIAKQELEKQVSTLSRTKENREVEKLKEEKAELKREKDQLAHDNKHFKSQIATIQRDLDRRQQQLSSQQSNNNHYYQLYQEYERKYREFIPQRNKLIQDYEALQKRLTETHTIGQENEKLRKSRQTLENRVKEIEQELQETQQKLSLATMRLRGVNTHSELGGGGSRSDQLKNEFSQIKMGLFHDASSKVLSGWRDQGSNFTFRSEEFSQIKSILSQRVFGDAMTYFAQDKTEVDAELHLVMDALSSIKDFSPTPAIFQEIQEKVQVGLLRAKGVDHSDEVIEQYIEETTQCINQDLKSIANLETTDEALREIKEFVKAGLKIVRDVVNDANSGELFIPENGTIFDDNAHETRDEHPGKIKMTICAGYRIKGTTLVKADVMTHEPEPTLQPAEQSSVDPQPINPQTQQPESGTQKPETAGDTPKAEETANSHESLSGQGDSTFTKPQSSDSSQEHSKASHENSVPNELEKTSRTFKGKVTKSSGLSFRNRPQKDSKTGTKAAHNDDFNFEGWVVGEPWNDPLSNEQRDNNRWYKLAGQDRWLPAVYVEVEGEFPSNLELTESMEDKYEYKTQNF